MPDTWPFDAGAFGLDGSLLTGRTLLNLDTEDWGEIFIGCAGKNPPPGFCMPEWFKLCKAFCLSTLCLAGTCHYTGYRLRVRVTSGAWPSASALRSSAWSYIVVMSASSGSPCLLTDKLIRQQQSDNTPERPCHVLAGLTAWCLHSTRLFSNPLVSSGPVLTIHALTARLCTCNHLRATLCAQVEVTQSSTCLYSLSLSQRCTPTPNSSRSVGSWGATPA